VESTASSGVSSWPSLDRVCVLVLGARVVLQHAGDRLPSGGKVDGAYFAGGALVPQLREPTTDVPVLFQDRFVDLGLAAVVVVSHTEQYAGCRVIVLANGEYSLVRRAGVPDVAEALDERLDGLPGGYGDEDRLEAGTAEE
jgi:hypothetical protein